MLESGVILERMRRTFHSSSYDSKNLLAIRAFPPAAIPEFLWQQQVVAPFRFLSFPHTQLKNKMSILD